ncbi:anthrone oxygenase family protein [Streptomyces canus]
MKPLQTVVLLTSTVSTGLLAGLFAGFAYSVMPGLGRSSDRTLVEAMQNINKAIIGPTFMLPFMGSIPLLALAAVLAWRGHSRPVLPWIITALLLYLVAFGITGAVNVPLNDQLVKVTSLRDADTLAMARKHFESRWVTWNLVRALLHTAAFGCLAWALVTTGAAQIAPIPGRGQPAVPGHHHLVTDTRQP